jgi:tRNA (cytidine56-2'-O)-methyltransferase
LISWDLKLRRVIVLRWGHRPRDKRLTTHIALAARAFEASGIILTDVNDKKIKETISKIVSRWGGSFFFKMGIPWMTAIEDWKAKNGVTVHLTAYGENIESSTVMQRILATRKDVMVIVGSQKVPQKFFSKKISDFNVAIGNQPHSECSSLAVFLDRFFGGKELIEEFEHAKLRIIPKKHGKKILDMSKT